MKEINKNLILSIIEEEFTSDVDEMSRKTSSEKWGTSGEETPATGPNDNGDTVSGAYVLSPQLSMQYAYRGPMRLPKEYSDKIIGSKNPETGEIEAGVVYPFRIRIGPLGHRLLMFRPYFDNTRHFTDVNKVYPPMFLDPETRVVHMHLPRNSYYGTTTGSEGKEMGAQEWSKRYSLYKTINSFFLNDQDIRISFSKCGIPIVKAQKIFDKRTTDKYKNIDIDNEHTLDVAYDGPNILFKLHTIRDVKDVSEALSQIFDSIEKIDSGEQPDPYIMTVSHQPRESVKATPNAQWKQELRNNSKDYHSLTQKYRLNKKSVQRGEIGLTLKNNFFVAGKIMGDQYVMRLKLEVTMSVRGEEMSTGQLVGDLFDPISVQISSPLPNNADVHNFTVRKYKDFYNNLLMEGLNDMKTEILNLDPGDILSKLMPTPDDVARASNFNEL